ncbi:MAG: S-layer homology domain-containing protein [Clostridia bacterium]|nr:S-layer homology domain-containing protein [Clostridia bacterium]
MDGIISPEFEPLLETVKKILFGTHEEVTEPTDEETTQPTEQPEEKPTEAPTEAPTEESAKNPDNGNGGGYVDEGEDVTEAVTQAPTQPPTQSITFSDINQAPWAEVAVKALVERKIINGYPDGTFKPNNPITRAEFAKIIVLASGRYDAKATCTFTDVPKERWDYP